jgi:hypothetical protein
MLLIFRGLFVSASSWRQCSKLRRQLFVVVFFIEDSGVSDDAISERFRNGASDLSKIVHF